MLTPVPFLTAVPHVEKKQLILEGTDLGGGEGCRNHEDSDVASRHTAPPSAT